MKVMLKNGMSVLYKDGMSLTGMNIVSIVADSKEDRFNLRMLLTGGLKVDKDGCHPLGLIPNHKQSLSLGSNDGNMSSGSGVLANSIKENYSLEEKLRIIDTLTSALKNENSTFYDHTKETEEKLLALIRSI